LFREAKILQGLQQPSAAIKQSSVPARGCPPAAPARNALYTHGKSWQGFEDGMLTLMLPI